MKRTQIQCRNAQPDQRYAQDGVQRRYSTLESVTVDTATRTFEGYASVFGSMNSYREIFLPGCFKRTIAKPPLGRKPSMYLQHDRTVIPGQWLEFREDDRGLFVRGQFVDSDVGRHAMALVRERIATGLSLGFLPVDYRDEDANDWDKCIRYIMDCDVYEVSIVEIASDKLAGVTHVRAIRSDMTRREIEDVLHSQGATRAAARAMASAWRPKGDARDAPPQGDEAQARDAQAIADLVTRMRAATADIRKRN